MFEGVAVLAINHIDSICNILFLVRAISVLPTIRRA